RSLGQAHRIYQAFRELDYDGGLRFNPLYATGLARDNTELHISSRQWGEFLVELWDAWDRDGRTIRVDPLQGWDQLAGGRRARIACAFSGRCTESFAGIKADGTVYSCGRSLDDQVLPFGNLNDTPLGELLEVPARRALLNRIEWLQQGECAGCRWWAFCHGGCPNDAQIAYGDLLRRTCWCEGRKLFFEHAFRDRVGVQAAPAPEDHEDLFGCGSADGEEP
ncbi:MAG: SPASM domain-containing protein, partial [bacterium]